jgi:hypothetical protein
LSWIAAAAPPQVIAQGPEETVFLHGLIMME